MWDNALYYTFSTIAQALAAAMALLAAFAMYRLKAVDDECKAASELAESHTGGGARLRQYYAVSQWPELVKNARAKIKDYPGDTSLATALIDRVVELRKSHKKILLALWISLALTALVVTASVWILTCVPTIGADTAVCALNGGVAAFIACLAAYFWLIWISFRP